MIKLIVLLFYFLFLLSCLNNRASSVYKETYFETDSNYCKKIILMGETCLSNYNDSLLYILLDYDAFHDTSLFVVIKNIQGDFILKTSYFDPVKNFDLYYYNQDGDSLKSIYTTETRKLDKTTVNKIINLINNSNFWHLANKNIKDETHFDGTWITLSISLNGQKNQIKRLLTPRSETSELFNQLLSYINLNNFNANRYKSKY